jgi:hypothetical protein
MDSTHILPVSIHNDMDFVTLQIMTFDDPNEHNHQSISLLDAPLLQRSPCLNPHLSNETSKQSSLPDSSPPSLAPCKPSDLQQLSSTSLDPLQQSTTPSGQAKSSSSSSLVLPQKVMAHIAAYYVQLHPVNSPREVAIRTMNSLTNHPF